VIFKKNRTPTLSGPLPDYWVSIGDLMSGLLLVFILLLVVAMYNYAAFTRARERRVDQRSELLQKQEERLIALEEKKRQLIEALKTSLAEVDVQVDELTGVVRIGEGILFQEDRAELVDEGKQTLARIYDQYIQVVLSPQYEQAVDRIVIEGHTNSRGSYLHNLTLSQQRANAVMRYWLGLAGADQALLHQKIVSSGRSWADLIRNEHGSEDPVRSRRIEIAFRLKESHLLRSVYEDLRGNRQ